MHFISKILRGTVDESVHRAFLRYGKGQYEGPAAEITLTKAGKAKVRSTYLYQDLIASVFAQHAPVDTISVSGIILGYEVLNEPLAKLGITAGPFTKKPRTMLFQSKISGTFSKSQLVLLYDEIGEMAYLFLKLNAGSGWTHTPKTSIPSAQKEAQFAEQLKHTTTQINPGTRFLDALLEELVPDFIDRVSDTFSTLRIENTYTIEELVFPPNKDQLTSKEVRLQTKRKGRLYRKLILGDVEYTREHVLLV